MKSSEEILSFLRARRGNIENTWDDVVSATLNGDRLSLSLANNRAIRGIKLLQTYHSTREPRSLSASNDLSSLKAEPLEEFLFRKLGDRLQVRK